MANDRKRFIDLKRESHAVYTEEEMYDLFQADNSVIHKDENYFTWLQTKSDSNYCKNPEYLMFENGWQYPDHATYSTIRQLAVILSQMRDSADAIGSENEDEYNKACESYWTVAYHKDGKTYEAKLPFFGAEEFSTMESMICDMIDITND